VLIVVEDKKCKNHEVVLARVAH